MPAVTRSDDRRRAGSSLDRGPARSRLSALAPAIAGLALCALPSAARAAGWGTVRGIVFSEGAPAAGVTVAIAQGPQTQTDRRGAFSFRLPAGVHQLLIARPSADPQRARPSSTAVLVEADQTTELLADLSDDGSVTVRIESPRVSARQPPAETARPKTARALIEGRTLDGRDGAPVSGVRIFARALSHDEGPGDVPEARSDAAGRFTLKLAPGRYELTAIHPEHATARVPDVKLTTAHSARVVVRLHPAAQQLEDYVVRAPRITGSTVGLLDRRRAAAEVTDVLGAEQITKSGATHAAAALRRVTGITVVGGRYVYVRGLGERYASTLLNGATLPSPEPDRRVVPLDLFPAATLESVVIQKSYSPRMPGEFGGGTVQLRTRSYPRDLSASIKLSAGALTGTTFANGLSGSGGSLDWLGVDGGTRALPADVKAASQNNKLDVGDLFSGGLTPQQLQRLGRLLPNRWSTQRSKVWPAFSLTGTLGDSFQLGSHRAGVLAALTYRNRPQVLRRKLAFTSVGRGGRLEVMNRYDWESLDDRITLGAILTGGIELAEGHDIKLTSIVDRITDDEARLYQGSNGDVGAVIRVARLQWVERMLAVEQLAGHHHWKGSLRPELSWRYTFSLAKRDEPDRLEMRYDQEPSPSREWLLSNRPEGNQRLFSALVEYDHDLRFDGALHTELWRPTTFRGGGALVVKSRNVDTRRFRFERRGPDTLAELPPDQVFAADNITPQRFQLDETTRATDNYAAEQQLWAAYLLAETKLHPALTLKAGARLEGSRQFVRTFELFNPSGKEIRAELGTIDPLPSLAMTWRFAEKMLARASYGRTVSRPSFRELSPAPRVEVTGGWEVVGNPKLSRATIDNVDVRWEWYPDRGESISAGAFYKHFADPIEMTVQSGAQLFMSFQNARAAHNVGVELELRKSLRFVHRWLRDVYVAANGALIYSRIALRNVAGSVQTSSERALQGQSPYVVNVQLGYDNADTATSGSLLYNVYGPRIAQVGALGAPDIYEQPFHRVDAVFRQGLPGAFAVTLKAKNLINPRMRFKQGSVLTDTFRRGRSFTVALSKTF